MRTLGGCRAVGWNPTLQVEGALPAGILLTRGALEGVVAAGGKLNGAFAQAYGVLHRDVQAGHGGKAGFLVQAC